MAIITLADAKTYLRIDGDDFDSDAQRAMASAEATIKGGDRQGVRQYQRYRCGTRFDFMLDFFDSRGGVQENKYSALDFGINNLLTTLQYWPEEAEV